MRFKTLLSQKLQSRCHCAKTLGMMIILFALLNPVFAQSLKLEALHCTGANGLVIQGEGRRVETYLGSLKKSFQLMERPVFSRQGKTTSFAMPSYPGYPVLVDVPMAFRPSTTVDCTVLAND